MNTTSLRSLIALVPLLAVACAEPAADSTPDRRDGSAGSTLPQKERRTQASQHGSAAHWIAAGASGRTGRISTDGTPATPTAQFVNAGNGVDYSSVNSNGWLVASETGWVQKLQTNGDSFGSEREALGGSGSLNFLASGGGRWLVGGDNGGVQEVDRNGQPKGTPRTPFSSSAKVTAGAYGSSQWLIGTADGRLLRVSASQLQPQSSVQQFPGGAGVVDIVRGPSSWYAFTGSEVAEVNTGGPRTPVTIASGRTITEAAVDGSTVAVGAADGSVLVSQLSNLSGASWQNALGSNAVRSLVTDGTDWLAVGDSGRVRRIDGSGNPQGSVETVASGRDLGSARPRSNGWWVGVADVSAIQKLDSSLQEPAAGSELLGGAAIHEVAAHSGGLLAVGADGKYRMLASDGSPDGGVQTLPDSSHLEGAEWNGARLMVVGDGGRVALLKKDGTVATRVTRLSGADLTSVSWSGRYWLIVGAGGTVLRLRPDGTVFQQKISTGLDTAEFAEFNGDQWIVVGSKGTKGAFMMLNEDGSTKKSVVTVDELEGTLRAAEWDGLEWLAGGDEGIVARIDQSGSIITRGQTEGVRDVLYGYSIRSIEFNATHYLIGGDFGAVRKLDRKSVTIRPAVAVNGFADVRSVEWSDARGFPGGPCISKDFCLDGTCIGGISADGFCCESKCDGPCQSCRRKVTGQPDGVCAPVPEGDEPPERKQKMGQDCLEGAKGICEPGEDCEKYCNLNGTCDGNGQCAYYGTDVKCADAICRNGVEKSAAYCNGSGDCVVDGETQCDPYAACKSGANECKTSCSGGEDCVEGYVCVDGECVDPSDQMNADAGTDGGNGDGNNSKNGCSTAGSRGGPLAPWFLLVPVLAVIRRRREPSTCEPFDPSLRDRDGDR